MSNKMWGGRFAAGPDAIMEEINASIDFDQRLAAQDIAGSKAHAAMLAKQGIVSKPMRREIEAGPRSRSCSEIEAGEFAFSRALEDIHMNVEARLQGTDRRAGRAGCTPRARATTRSRPISACMCARPIDRARRGRSPALQRALARRPMTHAATIMPGFTHLQTAQPVTFGHHLLAYVEMLERDRGRFADARVRLNECPLGAAALAGTSYPDRPRHDGEGARLRPADARIRSMPSSARDFALEALAAAAICGDAPVAAGRRDRAVDARAQFGFVDAVRRLHDRLVDHAAEAQSRCRRAGARQGRAASSARWSALLIVMKGLPLAYSKDMQEDKEPTFDALDNSRAGARGDDRHGRAT